MVICLTPENKIKPEKLPPQEEISQIYTGCLGNRVLEKEVSGALKN